VVHNPETIKRFEEGLRRQEKQQSMLSAVEQGREVAADPALDAADQAVQSYQKEMLFSQGTSGHEQLSLVRLALKRLDEGTYGECIHCGKTIGLKRLEALPWTPYCIDCREKIENGEIEDPVRAA
jgi:DnaK suppressor protein